VLCTVFGVLWYAVMLPRRDAVVLCILLLWCCVLCCCQ